MRSVELGGRMILEGPFLEQVVAAYLLKNGREVVSRIETGGVSHDVLVKTYNGHILYECTGQREITEGKIDKFHRDVLTLHDVLKGEGGIVEAVFAASVHDDAWTPSARNALELVRESLKKRIKAELKVISGLELLKELFKSGVLGLRLVKGKLHFAGPEDYAIRYDADSKQFKISFAPIELWRFRELPYSFLPSFYWEQHYRTIYEESAKGKEEPFTIWTYYYDEGVNWSSSGDIVEAYAKYLNLSSHAYVMERGDDYIIEEYTSARRNRSYNVYMFSNASNVDSSEAGKLIGKAIRLIDKIRVERSYLMEEKFSVYIYSATEDWSFKAWGDLKKNIPEPLRADISDIRPVRGNELLLTLLNSGVLGLRFKTRNEATLVGPGIDAVRISRTDAGRGLTISNEP
ncbi:MAG: hypothetical protein QXQ70_07065 [Candidatus Caldarchaeum sp.]